MSERGAVIDRVGREDHHSKVISENILEGSEEMR